MSIMDVLSTSQTSLTSPLNGNSMVNKISFKVSSNWLAVESSKTIENVISCELAAKSPPRMTLDDIVDERRCLEIKPNNDDKDGCTIEIKMKNNLKILRIGVVSEASVLEIFRDAGEYATTCFAELIDEFEDASVYFAEISFDRPTTEASMKFTRIKNSNRTSMFLYGIRIILEEIVTKDEPEKLFDFDMISDLLKMTMGARKRSKENNGAVNQMQKVTEDIIQNALDFRKEKLIENNNEKPNETKICIENATKLENNFNINNEALETLINTKLQHMEIRIMNKIDSFEAKTNKKLDDIMAMLQTIKNNE